MTNEQKLLLEMIPYVLDTEGYLLDNKWRALISWPDFFELIKAQHVFPTIYKMIYQYIPDEFKKQYEDEYGEHVRRVDNSLETIRYVAGIGEKNNINILIIKGYAAAQLLYNDKYGRHFADIDCLVNERDVQKVHGLLLEAGFIHACGRGYLWDPFSIEGAGAFDVLPYPTLKTHLHHEYFEYYRKMGDDSYIQLEIGRYIHDTIKKDHIEEFMSSPLELMLDGQVFKTLNIPHTFLYLCENAYTELQKYCGKAKLKDYMDLYAVINRFQNCLDWNYILLLANKYRMLHKVNYALSNLAEIVKDEKINIIVEHLDLGKAEYDINSFETQPILNLGCDLTELLFSNLKRKEQILKAIKALYISNFNLKPIALKENTLQETEIAENYTYFKDIKYFFSIGYMLSCDKEYLYLSVLIEKVLFDNLDRFEILAKFIDLKKESGVFCKEVILKKENNEIIAKEEETNDCLNAKIEKVSYLDSKSVIISASIPYDRLPVDESGRFGFNAALQEYVYMDRVVSYIGASHKTIWDNVCWEADIIQMH